MARDALETQVSLGGSITLVGGDPSMEVGRTIDRWFTFATDHDLDLDVHVTPRGAAGYSALDRLAEATIAHDYQDRVTAVHGWGLAGLPEWWLDPLLERLGRAGVNLTVCYNSLRESMPINSIDHSEVTLAHGTDNDRDFVYPHGNADSLEAAQIMSYILIDDWHFPPDYRWSETNPALETLWEAVTVGGAKILGLNEYGTEIGTPADLVLFDEPSPQWAIIAQATKRAVIKDGRIVARDGELTADVGG
jgi:cytosine/adenosine deaminase-related metal-dependent hydrolase